MFVIHHKLAFFIFSTVTVVAAIVAIAVWGLRPGVDFSGGTLVEVRYVEERPTIEALESALLTDGFEVSSVRVSENGFVVRMETLPEGAQAELLAALSVGGTLTPSIERSSSIGPTVGQELRRKTLLAITLVVLMIILYVAFAFRGVSKPVSSWVYGLVAIVTLLHDIIIPTGVFAALGYFQGLEADTLFVVALLTILGLSVNDTIVVFDRIRENLKHNQERSVHEPFAETVGKSLQQTYVRSFNTSFTVVLVLAILFFLGGPTIHSFILTLLVGQIAGTYSSIFLASPMLVAIAERKVKG